MEFTFPIKYRGQHCFNWPYKAALVTFTIILEVGWVRYGYLSDMMSKVKYVDKYPMDICNGNDDTYCVWKAHEIEKKSTTIIE